MPATVVPPAQPAAGRGKLRVLFSTACFGSSRLDAWHSVGFTEASGSQGIYANSAASYMPFLAAWASEKTFAEAVKAANAADPFDLGDKAAKAYYKSRNLNTLAAQVDSTRHRAGPGTTRIYSNP